MAPLLKKALENRHRVEMHAHSPIYYGQLKERKKIALVTNKLWAILDTSAPPLSLFRVKGTVFMILNDTPFKEKHDPINNSWKPWWNLDLIWKIKSYLHQFYYCKIYTPCFYTPWFQDSGVLNSFCLYTPCVSCSINCCRRLFYYSAFCIRSLVINS